MLKLVSSNKFSPVRAPQPQEKTRSYSRAPFGVDVQLKGPHLFSMTAKDPSHCLECELILEVDEQEGGTVICHLPQIDDEMLLEFVSQDETLYGIVMIQFQMKLLQQLLKFCLNHLASRLVIYTDDDQADDLGIYQEFLIHKNQTLTQHGEQTELTIPCSQRSYEEWVNFMEHVKLKFQKILWQNQRSNLAIRRYLKFHPFS